MVKGAHAWRDKILSTDALEGWLSRLTDDVLGTRLTSYTVEDSKAKPALGTFRWWPRVLRPTTLIHVVTTQSSRSGTLPIVPDKGASDGLGHRKRVVPRSAR